MRISAEDNDVAAILVFLLLPRLDSRGTVEPGRNNTSWPKCVNRNKVRVLFGKWLRGLNGLTHGPESEEPVDKVGKRCIVVSRDETRPRVSVGVSKHVGQIPLGSAII